MSSHVMAGLEHWNDNHIAQNPSELVDAPDTPCRGAER